MFRKLFGACLLVAMSAAGPQLSAATFVDIVLVVDESGSMAGEHAWLGGMVTSLNTRLEALGYTVKFGLYGFGKSGAGIDGRELLDSGTAAQFLVADNNLVTSGGTEDGYTGIKFASDNYTFTAGSARNYILVTDEDRDVRVAANTFATTAALLSGQSALLNAVLNNPFGCTGGTGSVIGRTTSSGYRVDGSGGYTTCASPTRGNGDGATETDYVPLALNSGGAAWNLNILRNGGTDAASFTAAFVDIKVEEIITQTGIPEPSAYVLVGSALAGLLIRRRMTK